MQFCFNYLYPPFNFPSFHLSQLTKPNLSSLPLPFLLPFRFSSSPSPPPRLLIFAQISLASRGSTTR